jgi:hypothetical protein
MNLEGRIKRLEGTERKAPRVVFWDRDQGPPPEVQGDVMLVRWLSKDEHSHDPAIRGGGD